MSDALTEMQYSPFLGLTSLSSACVRTAVGNGMIMTRWQDVADEVVALGGYSG